LTEVGRAGRRVQPKFAGRSNASGATTGSNALAPRPSAHHSGASMSEIVMVGSFRGAARSMTAATARGSVARISAARGAAVLVSAALLSLAGCASYLPSFSGGGTAPEPGPAPMGAAAPPASLRPDEIVGRWGIAAYHRPEDRARTEAAARGQCGKPYVINRSSTGVSMLGHDSPQVQDMILKAGPDGKTYVGPNPQAPDNDDREVVSFDGRALILKWVDPEVASRYGMMVLVRCGAEGTVSRGPRPAPAPAAPR
jgi:hypothetical protein